MKKAILSPRRIELKKEQYNLFGMTYHRYWKSKGYKLFCCPYDTDDLEYFITQIKPDLIILGGGYDKYTPKIKEYDFTLIRLAITRNIRLIGICCGMWSINAYFGGTLEFNEKHGRRNIRYIYNRFVNGNNINVHKLQNGLFVNSYHRKVIKRLGYGLDVLYYSGDGEIEAVTHDYLRIIGIQFHLRLEGVDAEIEKEVFRFLKR